MFCFLFLILSVFGQQKKKAFDYLQARGEVYFCFNADYSNLEYLSTIISIAKVQDDKVFAYANQKGFDKFLLQGYDYEVLTPPSLLHSPQIAQSTKELLEWDTYPTYQQYVDLMCSFMADYPHLCKVYEIGTTPGGHSLLFIKISDNPDEKEAEPEFMYTASMHGDELPPYVLMLRYIDYLLSNYGQDDRITHLIDNIEIWINPLANPDGAYYYNDFSVVGAKRFNLSGVDLNRNFPDPQIGGHPDGNSYQAETLSMMNFMEEHNFVLSANMHTGAEVVNYPWDTWSKLHADNSWYVFISKEYADTAQFYSPSGYLTGVSGTGYINGFTWYTTNGSRQDYANYFLHCREVTLELTNTKTPSSSTLPAYWNYNYRSFINYMAQCLYGVHGIITDAETGLPLKAFVEIDGHDIDSSQVYSHPANGDYHRLLAPGTYDISFSAPGYTPKTIQDVSVENYQQTKLDVQLNPLEVKKQYLYYKKDFPNDEFCSTQVVAKSVNSFPDKVDISPNPFTRLIKINLYLTTKTNVDVCLYNVEGQLVFEDNLGLAFPGENQFTLGVNNNLAPGFYVCSIITNNRIFQQKIIRR